MHVMTSEIFFLLENVLKVFTWLDFCCMLNIKIKTETTIENTMADLKYFFQIFKNFISELF